MSLAKLPRVAAVDTASNTAEPKYGDKSIVDYVLTAFLGCYVVLASPRLFGSQMRSYSFSLMMASAIFWTGMITGGDQAASPVTANDDYFSEGMRWR